mmetsp:Transcript_92760/g.258380  ORF Transcript_92760/g.258380 Transcript_92760/m.258380 type:complete len:91 (-) Transcript_92760:160-432(-)
MRPVRGISKEDIETMTTLLTYSSGCNPEEKAGNITSDQCTICLEQFQAGEKLRMLPCLHRYHCNCVDRWLLQARSPECPLCRNRIVQRDV